MDRAIIDGINAAVGADDVLYHLGLRRRRLPGRPVLPDGINCRTVYLVWGNHDREDIPGLSADCYAQGGRGSGLDIPGPLEVDGQFIWLNHYPMLSWDGSHKGTDVARPRPRQHPEVRGHETPLRPDADL